MLYLIVDTGGKNKIETIMTEIKLILCTLIIFAMHSFVPLHAQNAANNLISYYERPTQVIYDQPIYGNKSLLSTYSNLEDSGMYAADDFELETAIEVSQITVYGSQYMGNLLDLFQGFDLYLYEDNFGIPDGDPTQIGTGVLELRNIDPNNPALTICYDGDRDYSFSVNIIEANGGNTLVLDGEKKYWLCAFPRLFMAPVYNGDKSWRWKGGLPPIDPFEFAHRIDPDNRFGTGIEWQPLQDLQLAFKIEGGILGVKENATNKITIFPNPTKDLVNVKSSSNLNINNLKVYNMLGKEMDVHNQNDVIDLSKLASGIYLLRIDTDLGNQLLKVIKQ